MKPFSRTVKRASRSIGLPRSVKHGPSRQAFKSSSQSRESGFSGPGSPPRSSKPSSPPRSLKPSSPPQSLKPSSPPHSLKLEPHSFIYGGDWKGDQIQGLLDGAIDAGFRRIDTFTSKALKRERLLGSALRAMYLEGNFKREAIYIQAKFTVKTTKDLINAPIYRDSPFQAQIDTSVTLALDHLRHLETSSNGAYIDCMMVHMPNYANGQVLKTWKILEPYVPHQIRTLGISKTDINILTNVYDKLKIKPSVVQNDFFLTPRFDGPVRGFCRRRGISYQSVWTTTGPEYERLLGSKVVTDLALRAEVDREVTLHALVENLGIEVLHSNPSLDVTRDTVTQLVKMRKYAVWKEKYWTKMNRVFRGLIGDAEYDPEDFRQSRGVGCEDFEV